MNKTVITLLLSLLSVGLSAQPDWKLKRDEDGIKVYAANTPNSDFKAVRVECTVKARLPQLVAFLLDVEKQHDWVYNNKCSQLIKKPASNELIAWSEYSVPWPCCNRDYVSHITITQKSPQLTIIDAKAEPWLVPVKEGKVRVVNSVSHWDITILGTDQLKIVYTVQCDPAGAIPAWLTNMFVTKGPFQTFEKLRACVDKPQYQNAHFDFIKE